jgi:hypothetical protein
VATKLYAKYAVPKEFRGFRKLAYTRFVTGLLISRYEENLAFPFGRISSAIINYENNIVCKTLIG